MARRATLADIPRIERRGDLLANILIIGASKGIGLEAVKRGLACGHIVRAFARSADRIAIGHKNLEKRRGAARSSADVASALDGMDAVIQAIGVSVTPDMLLKRTTLFSASTRVLLDTMGKTGVKRLICVTGFGAADSRSRMGHLQRTAFRLFLGRIYDDKEVQESLIRNSDLDWVIARPVILRNGPRTGRYQVLVDPRQWRGGVISRANVADFLINQVEDDSCLRKTPVLTN